MIHTGHIQNKRIQRKFSWDTLPKKILYPQPTTIKQTKFWIMSWISHPFCVGIDVRSSMMMCWFLNNVLDFNIRTCLQGERVTLVLGLPSKQAKDSLGFKQISQVGLPYHLGQLDQLYCCVSSCMTFFVLSKIRNKMWSSQWETC